MKRKLLFISMSLPFAKVSHAGGQIFNYYINRFIEDKNNEITLIAKVLPDEKKYLDTVNPNMTLYTVSTPENTVAKYFSYLKSMNSKVNPFYKYGNVLTKEIYDQIREILKKLKASGYKPDVISLEWTWILLYIDTIKNYFPDAKYIATEHDVTFLGLERRYKTDNNPIKKMYDFIRFKSIKKNELKAARQCDVIFVLNEKDKNLLLKESFEDSKIGILPPYFSKPQKVNRIPEMKDLLFYGAMNRDENSKSALWFIDNVMPRIQDLGLRFVIVGNKPQEEILKRESDQIVVTGFIDDVTPYFEKSICLVASLVLGAGIKIKVLEAMAMGIPVLTNNVGIEGIDAVDGESYLHCETPEDYEKAIRAIVKGEIDIRAISRNSLNMISQKYDFDRAFEEYSGIVYALAEEIG
ncbi:glycosyltransferase [Dorea sp. YH-dor228]|uniref:glycosyltransferase n=1 Tax=Dorea sp. YH-dor228 TaxID=3151120 RepID=UPI003242F34D